MDKIYVGENASKCDGSIYGYSTFVHILTSKPKTITEGEKVSFLGVITIGFTPNMKDDYSF